MSRVVLFGWKEAEMSEVTALIEDAADPGERRRAAALFAEALGIGHVEAEPWTPGAPPKGHVQEAAWEGLSEAEALLRKHFGEHSPDCLQFAGVFPASSCLIFEKYAEDADLSRALTATLCEHFAADLREGETIASTAIRLLGELAARRRPPEPAQPGARVFDEYGWIGTALIPPPGRTPE